MIRKHGLILAGAMMTVTMPAVAQSPIRTETIEFARGANSATIRGSVKGYDIVDHIVGARAGQSMTVSMQANNGSVYFNLLPPHSQEAIFNGSIAGSRFDGRLKDSGEYRIRVYLMRNAARRGEQVTYIMSVGVNGQLDNPGDAAPAPIGSETPVSAGNMPAYCRGEASQQYGARPSHVRTGRVVASRGGRVIDGTADQGRNGIKRFRCRFDARRRFINVMALPRDGY